MLLFWPLVIPFLTAVLCLLAWRSVATQRIISFLGALALFAAALRVLLHVMENGPVAAQSGGWPAPFGITFVADLLSATLVALVGLVAVAVLTFARADVTPEEEHHGFHPLTHGLLAGIVGAFLTGDVFNLYVWFEVMLIASFGLLVIGGGKAQFDGAVKYVGLNLIGTVAFIAGVGLLYGATGALNMADLHFRLQGRETEVPIIASAAFLIFAFGSKAALFPVFFWLPASYHTPSFATSAIFAALLTKVGVYALFRVFTLVYDIDGTPIQTLLVWVAVLTMVVGALGALVQPTIRRILGFGVVSSVGYMVLGLAVFTPLAILGGLFYMLQDILTKAALFMGAGAAARVSGSEDLERGAGIWRARPWFAALFLLPALSLAGIPPFAGFWAKLTLARATVESQDYALTFAILAVGLLTLLAMARVWSAMFWSAHPDGDAARPGAAPWDMVLPVAVMTALIVGVGIAAAPFLEAAARMAGELMDPAAYIAAVALDLP